MHVGVGADDDEVLDHDVRDVDPAETEVDQRP